VAAIGLLILALRGCGGDPAVAVAAAVAPALRQPECVAHDAATVRGWLAQRLDYAPKFSEYTADGIHLIGAATADLNGRSIAILVYNVGAVRVALASWPGQTAPRDEAETPLKFVAWTAQGFEYWAFSTADAVVLRRFRASLQAHTRHPPG